MTSSDQPDRPNGAGVFVVRDPGVVAALEALLQPHYTGPVAAPDGPTADDIVATAVARARGLLDVEIPFADEATIEHIVDYVHAKALDAGRQQATAEGRTHAEDLQDRLTQAETSVAHAERRVDKAHEQLEAALAKITDLETATTKPAPASSGSALRRKDQKAWAALADRMEREAMSQPKTPADVLRVCAKFVRDEIAAVYGTADRAKP